MRQIVLDTETTGLDPAFGHRVIEIGAVELVNRRLTGRHFHKYINPLREIDENALKVHGITQEFLADKPFFKDIIAEFVDFVRDAELIIHNAPFDVKFLNYEFKLHGQHYAPIDKLCSILDTLVLAREMHPGQRNSLDALCQRYGINNLHRQLHGALLDAEILADVYLGMTGGQVNLFDEVTEVSASPQHTNVMEFIQKPVQVDLPIIYATEQEQQAHQAMIDMLAKKSGHCLWKD